MDYLQLERIDDIAFVSVDWSHAWLDSLDMEAVDQVDLSEETAKLLRGYELNLSCIKQNQYHSLPYSTRVSQIVLLTAPVTAKSTLNSITLSQCLKEYTKTEVLENGNEWYCSSCKSHQPATKRVTFWLPKLPKILILSLKRFEFRDMSGIMGEMGYQSSRMGTGLREKIEDFVDFPLEGLDLGEFCHSRSTSMKDVSTVYDLFAVCNHFGRMGFGHYTAFARDFIDDDQNRISNQWYSFDDDIVKKCITADEVKTRAAYILFYRRRNEK